MVKKKGRKPGATRQTRIAKYSRKAFDRPNPPPYMSALAAGRTLGNEFQTTGETLDDRRSSEVEKGVLTGSRASNISRAADDAER
jgi:hypothetical protein